MSCADTTNYRCRAIRGSDPRRVRAPKLHGGHGDMEGHGGRMNGIADERRYTPMGIRIISVHLRPSAVSSAGTPWLSVPPCSRVPAPAGDYFGRLPHPTPGGAAREAAALRMLGEAS